jgi:hypothetical protein
MVAARRPVDATMASVPRRTGRTTRRQSAVVVALVAVAAVGGCSDDDDDAAPAPPASPSTTTTTAAVAAVDPALSGDTIAVAGAAQVGQTLTARISPGLAGTELEWGWHRCTDVPACTTIRGADDPTYRLTEDDAWQVIRVIAATDRANEARTGPVVDPDPEPFTERGVVHPGRGTALAVVVAPGRHTVTVEAGCPVVVVAGVRTATIDGSRTTGGTTVEEPAARHELAVDGEGGLLTVGVSGDCDRATVEVTGIR